MLSNQPAHGKNTRKLMHPKIKNRPKGTKPADGGVEPLLPHEVTNQSASFDTASRRNNGAIQPLSGSANHARHHVYRKTQA